ncbi:hypothetical protein BC833DRAFT_626414 [Globomyces pollinis-pini]|nr:hypothetical protein BC833DRAFT_626414 [Globomyces pollinis-pini]
MTQQSLIHQLFHNLYKRKSHCKPAHCAPPRKHCATTPVNCGVVTTRVTQTVVCPPAPCQPKRNYGFGGYC